MGKVVIPTHMWASATMTFEKILLPILKLLYPLICGLLQPIDEFRQKMLDLGLLYPLICGLLQHDEARLEAVAGKGCYTHSYVGFCN